MTIYDFTAEETSLIAIYKTDTRAGTLAAIAAALPDMDGDFTAIAKNVSRKLAAMSDADFTAATFALADEDGGD
jgi:hypothetical protein